jgi:ribonuclease HI
MKLYTDGASRGNPGKAGGGIVLEDDGKVEEKSVYFGIKTNNEAEYLALIEGLKLAIARGARRLDVFMDSLLAVKQLQGDYRVKNPGIVPLFKEARALLGRFDSWEIRHVDRGENKKADKLANRAINLEGT